MHFLCLCTHPGASSACVTVWSVTEDPTLIYCPALTILTFPAALEQGPHVSMNVSQPGLRAREGGGRLQRSARHPEISSPCRPPPPLLSLVGETRISGPWHVARPSHPDPDCLVSALAITSLSAVHPRPAPPPRCTKWQLLPSLCTQTADSPADCDRPSNPSANGIYSVQPA